MYTRRPAVGTAGTGRPLWKEGAVVTSIDEIDDEMESVMSCLMVM